MDDYVIVGPLAMAKKLTEDLERIMLLRDMQFLELGKLPANFLGWMLERTVDGFRLRINPQLIEDIVLESGQAGSAQRCAGSERHSRG